MFVAPPAVGQVKLRNDEYLVQVESTPRNARIMEGASVAVGVLGGYTIAAASKTVLPSMVLVGLGVPALFLRLSRPIEMATYGGLGGTLFGLLVHHLFKGEKSKKPTQEPRNYPDVYKMRS